MNSFSMVSRRPIKVLSERIMRGGFEPTVVRLMEQVQKTVLAQPGLMKVETLSDIENHHKYIVLSKWESKEHYHTWLESEAFKACSKRLDEVLDVPGKNTRIFQEAHEDIFLL